MRSIHPQQGRTAIVVATILLASAGGCRNRQTAMTNPFMAPDRVPAPATRMLAPGTAQPYYQGDPLPLTQNTGPAQAEPFAATTMPVAPGSIGAWGVPPQQAASVQSAANEPTVSIPTDADSLRFALPQPPGEFTPPAAQVALQTPLDSAEQFAPTSQGAGPSQFQPVAQAIYQQPVVAAGESALAAAADAGPFATADFGSVGLDSSGPWRSPQIARSSAVVPASYQQFSPEAQAYVVQPSFASQQFAAPPLVPVAPQPSKMNVRLRAVPSSNFQQGESTTPRIRLPSYAPEAQPLAGSSAPVEQVAYVMPPNFASGGVLQTVQITALPSHGHPYIAPTPGPPPGTMISMATPTPAAGFDSSDGFRARSNAR